MLVQAPTKYDLVINTKTVRRHRIMSAFSLAAHYRSLANGILVPGFVHQIGINLIDQLSPECFSGFDRNCSLLGCASV